MIMREFLLAACLVLSICLNVRGIPPPENCLGRPGNAFSTKNATSNTYVNFISAVRSQLKKTGVGKAYRIPVLNPSVSDSKRFVFVDLSNRDGSIIILAIDATNLNVVAYQAGDKSYFLKDAPVAALNTLFPDTSSSYLSFSSSYNDLEKAGCHSRRETPLGLTALDSAITELFRGGESKAAASSLLVATQVVSGAVRFRFIEQRVRDSIRDGSDFLPDAGMVSLEDNWPALSLEIQMAFHGIFNKTVQLWSFSNSLVRVDSVRSPVVSGIAFLLYRCNTNQPQSNHLTHVPTGIIRMPLSIPCLRTGASKICTVQNSTTRISGPDGLCVDVRNGYDNDGNPIQLWPCGPQRNQQWTFRKDGTIQSLGKCLTAYGYSAGAYIMIYACNKAAENATKWSLSSDGTITNPQSGLVLTAKDTAEGTTLTLEANSHSPKQGWRAGDVVSPAVTIIKGYNDLCLETDNRRVWIGHCGVRAKHQQYWALYSDGTIRVNSNHSLCVTSEGNSALDAVSIHECRGIPQQRWLIKANGNIVNPSTTLVMEVKDSNVALQQIILYQPTGKPNQQWLAFF